MDQPLKTLQQYRTALYVLKRKTGNARRAARQGRSSPDAWVLNENVQALRERMRAGDLTAQRDLFLLFAKLSFIPQEKQ